jgi:hypothetical protein
MVFEIELGEKVKDSITGFTGTVVARSEYLKGCIQYQVIDKEPDKDIWIDEQQLKVKRGRTFKDPSELVSTRLAGGIRSHP